MIEPLRIQGPAIVTHNGLKIYTQGDVEAKLVRDVFNPKSTYGGSLGARVGSTRYELSFTPVGARPVITADPVLNEWHKFYPFSPQDVGHSIMNGAAVVHSLVDNSLWTFARAGLTKLPTLFLHPQKTLFGPMAIGCLPMTGMDLDDPAAFFARSSGSADTSFTGDVPTEIFEATYGSHDSDHPIGAHDGFEIEHTMQYDPLPSSAWGTTDFILQSLGLNCKFAPSNLDDAAIDALMNSQDSEVLVPGTVIGGNDIVLMGPQVNITLPKMGPQDNSRVYGIAKNRAGDVMFVNRLNWSGGTASRLISVAAAA